jgi:pilus assembly protein CpaE
MTLNEYKTKVDEQKELDIRNENLIEILKFYVLFAKLQYLSFYEFDYELNDFIYSYTVDTNVKYTDEKIAQTSYKENVEYTVILEDNGTIYGMISFDKKPIESKVVDELLGKIKNVLHKRFLIQKEILSQEALLEIFIISDEKSKFFADGLKTNLGVLLNATIVIESSINSIIKILREKIKKSIIIYTIEDEDLLTLDEKYLKNLNEFIVVIGPNNYDISLLCGQMDVYKYLSKDTFLPEQIKLIIAQTKNEIQNKYQNHNKMIAIAGISGGVGTTTIAMNSADAIAKNNPNKNILYIDLSKTKAISNLFLNGNPLPKHTVLDLLNIDDYSDMTKALENGLVKVRENFYAINGIQKHIDIDILEQSVFIEKFLDYLNHVNQEFNFVIIDLGQADASILNTTIYDIVNELWILTEMTLPHISKLKTFFSLMKRAGLKDKLTFLVNRYDSINAISVADVTSILNTSNDDHLSFDFKIPNDYVTLGYCWNFCELATSNHQNSIFVHKLMEFLAKKQLIEMTKVVETKKSFLSFLSIFGLKV